jgi:hypothetical protein
LKVNTGLTAGEEPVKYAAFGVKPGLGVASKVTVGGGAGVGVGVGAGVGVGGGDPAGGGATPDDPPPPPQPNSGTVMPIPKAIKTSRRFVLRAGDNQRVSTLTIEI